MMEFTIPFSSKVISTSVVLRRPRLIGAPTTPIGGTFEFGSLAYFESEYTHLSEAFSESVGFEADMGSPGTFRTSSRAGLPALSDRPSPTRPQSPSLPFGSLSEPPIPLALRTSPRSPVNHVCGEYPVGKECTIARTALLAACPPQIELRPNGIDIPRAVRQVSACPKIALKILLFF